jgi:endonuclease YncB( thermonuclease family)
MSEESLAFLQGLVEGRRVRVTLLRRDRYGRIVGLPYLPRLGFFFWPRVIPVEMIRAGMVRRYLFASFFPHL